MLKNRLRGFVFALIVGLLATVFNGIVPQKVEAKTMYTNLYATEGRDTTPIPGFGHNLTSDELYSLKFLDSNKYEVRGKWNKIITELDKLELKNFEPKISGSATLQEVYLHGIWSRDNHDMEDAWIKVFKPTTGEEYVAHLPIPAPYTNSFVLINLTSFLPTVNDLNNAYIRFQAKSQHLLPHLRAKTWHEQFKFAVKYEDHLANPQVIDGLTSTDIDWIKPDSGGNITISANWSGFGADVDFYKACVGTVLNDTHTACNDDYPANGTQNIIPSTPTPNTFGSITVPAQINGTKYYVYIKAFYKDKSTFSLAHSDGVTVDSQEPIVDILTPLNGSTLNKNIMISADADDNGGIGVEKVGFAYLDALNNYVDKNGNPVDPLNPFFYIDANGADGWSTVINSLNNADGPYKVAAVAFDFLGNSGRDLVNFTIDNTAPANPDVTGTPGDGEATLSWPSVPGAACYNIYREGILIVDCSTSLIFKNTGLTNGTKYHYRVTSKDALGNESTGTLVTVTPVTKSLGEILASSTFRPSGENTASPEPAVREENKNQGQGSVLAEEKTNNEPEAKEKAPYWGWLYLLIIYIMILIGYYYYYLKEEYTEWYWIFPLIVAILLWFINRSLSKVFEGGLASQLFWLWELIVLIIFSIYYNFWGRPNIEKSITRKFRKR